MRTSEKLDIKRSMRTLQEDAKVHGYADLGGIYGNSAARLDAEIVAAVAKELKAKDGRRP